jgi:hypothetical protein
VPHFSLHPASCHQSYAACNCLLPDLVSGIQPLEILHESHACVFEFIGTKKKGEAQLSVHSSFQSLLFLMIPKLQHYASMYTVEISELRLCCNMRVYVRRMVSLIVRSVLVFIHDSRSFDIKGIKLLVSFVKLIILYFQKKKSNR